MAKHKYDPRQQTIFDKCVIQNATINNAPSRSQHMPKPESFSFRGTPGQKHVLDEVSQREDVSISFLLSEAVDLWISTIKHRDRLRKDPALVSKVLELSDYIKQLI